MNLIERVAFDRPTETPDGFGGSETDWTSLPDSYETRGQFIYQRGSEAIEAARLAGRSIYKVRIRSSAGARGITAAWRMRDLRRGTIYNIREIDTITDRQWVYLTVESGVAA